MRKYATSYILALTIMLGELHTFWEKGEQHVENWIVEEYRPMTVQWNVKYAIDELNPILYFVAMFLFVPNRVNKTTVLSFILFASVDTLSYFYNYKTYGYGWMYFLLVICWLIVYFCMSRNKQKWNKHPL